MKETLSPHQQLQQAQQRCNVAENALITSRALVEQYEIRLRNGLLVGKNIPCSAGILPDGTIAVHVWVESSSTPNQLHIVSPSFIDEDGKLRKAFHDEKLGNVNYGSR